MLKSGKQVQSKMLGRSPGTRPTQSQAFFMTHVSSALWIKKKKKKKGGEGAAYIPPNQPIANRYNTTLSRRTDLPTFSTMESWSAL